MNRITKAFENSRGILIGYLTAGYPDTDTFLQWVDTTVEAGFNILEIGLPFSDPVADGPTIEKASRSVLQNGFSTSLYLDLVRKVRDRYPQLPLVTMSYYNPLAIKEPRIYNDLLTAGIDGMIIPDLPLIEGRKLYRQLNSMGLATPMLIPPTIDGPYLEELINMSSGFIYAVSRTGTTGEREEISDEGKHLIRRLKSMTGKPVAIGFGIKSAHQLAPIKGMVDAIIIGSALIRRLENGKSIGEWAEEIKKGAF